MPRAPIIIFLIFLNNTAYSQIGTKYAAVDSFVKSFPMNIRAESDMRVFIREMSHNFKTDEERLRAVYFWITENIAYDCEGYHNGGLSTEINTILKNRKAVCAGYSSLLYDCCTFMNIKCKIINGVARTDEDDLFANPDSLKSNHAWNAVK